MGIGREIYDFEKSVVRQAHSLCDLGNQRIRAEVAGEEKTGTTFVERYKSEYLAIDINGQDNSLSTDLCMNVIETFPELEGKFDVTTNYGTIEHVENQPEAFMNIDRLTKEGGIILHAFMLDGYWPGHSPWKYSEDFGFNMEQFYGIVANRFVFRADREDRKMGLFAYRKVAPTPLIEWETLWDMGLRYG